MKISLCSIDYSIEENSPILHLFCRDKDYKKYIIPVKDFYPYFYIEKWNYPLIEHNYSEFIRNIEYGYKEFILDFDLVRIYTYTPPQVRDLRQAFRDVNIKTLEADILFPIRYFVDSNIFTGIEYDLYSGKVKYPVDMPSRFRILVIDIEVFAQTEEELKTYKAPIIVYGIYDSLTDSYHIFTLKNIKKRTLNKYLIEKKPLLIHYYHTEPELLNALVKFFQEIEPDIILTFSPWDMNYTIGRMRELKVKYRNLSPIKITRLFRDKAKISGIQILDIAEMYRTTLRKQKWETLEFIAKKELKLDALYHDESVYEMWINEPSKVMIRNLRDVELVKLLNDELQLITYFDTIRRVSGCNISDTLYRSRIADILDLRTGREFNVVLPSRRFYKHVDYTGAKVFRCLKGIYKNVLVIDFTAMYPSICRALNIGYGTFISGQLKDGFFSIENLEESFQTSDIPSFVIKAFDKLEPVRKPFKDNMKKHHPDSKEYKFNKAVSDGLKSVINAEYGKFGYSGDWKKFRPAARLYEPRIAAAITYVGRILQEDLYSYLEKIGYRVLYGDTDSMFIKLKSDDIEESKQLLSKLNKYVKKLLKEKLKLRSTLELEEDKILDSIALLTKKRYGLKRKDGSYDWKGLELIKRNQPMVTQEVQKKLLKMILNGRSKESILEFFIDYCNNFKSKSIEEISLPLKLSKRPENFKTSSFHLKAFVYSRDILNIPLDPNRRFYVIHIKKVPEGYVETFTLTTKKGTSRHKVECIAFNRVEEIPDGFEIDWKIMKEKTVMSKSQDILSLLNINLDMLKQQVKGYRTLNNW